MQKIYSTFIKKIIFFLAVILFSAQLSKAQAVYVPYSYQLYQKFNSDVYSPNNSLHTALKPYLLDNSISRKYNEILNRGVDTTRKSWFSRKLFNEHLIHKETNEYTFYFDYITDMEVGRDIPNKITTTINTKAFQLGGTIGNKFFFYTSLYENQEKFPNYVYNYIKQLRFVPAEAYDRAPIYTHDSAVDWSYSTAIISYTPIKELNITLGQDKTFIGDGYRSLLLSDYSSAYPLLRLTANVGHLQYMMMWADLEDINLPTYDTYGNNRRKIAAFHYLDWNVTNKLSLGFFNAIIAAGANDQGKRHPFDFNYINPLLFASSLGPSTPYKDNVLVGFTGKYKILNNAAIYGQLLIDRFKASDFFSANSTNNTNGYQIGIRGADLFKVKGFNYLLEYNTAKPYTYAGQQSISSYTDYSESLGDPLGANFKEVIAILDYSVGRWDFQGQANYATYGLDAIGQNNGQNVTLAVPATITSATTGQGLHTKTYYGEGTISYVINPKYNFRIFGGTVLRQQQNSVGTAKTAWITFGLKSSFRNFYHDF
jgi:hypothetical protein